MRFLVGALAFSLFAFTGAARAADQAKQYYVQLIRGTDSDRPPQAGARNVGPKLSETLRCALKWTNYWEICQREVEVLPGRTTRVRLNSDREVEIDLRKPGTRTVAAFQSGQLVDRTSTPLGEAMSVIGAKRDEKSVWFIVVRRDKPGS